jgi:hypothetical protein
VSEVEAALFAEGPSLPSSLQCDWGPVTLAVMADGAGRPRRLAQELTVEGSRLFHLKQAGQLVLQYKDATVSEPADTTTTPGGEQ